MKEKLTDKVDRLIRESAKVKAQGALNVFRSLKNAFSNAALASGNINNGIDEITALSIVRKQIKQRDDSIEAFEKGERRDLVLIEKTERFILESLLPPSLTDEQLELVVAEAVDALQATTKKDMGKVIKRVVEVTEGAVDNRRISTAVAAKLN